jgi:cysteine desulfurase
VRRLYLDNAATTPLDERVFEEMRPYFSETFGNASSIHSFGREAKMALENARATIAQAIGAETGELFFTSGGTESDNFAMWGVSNAGRKRGKIHVVTAAAEHHAVLDPCEELRNHGYEVTVLPVDTHGAVEAAQLEKALRDETCLVSIMHSNNEVGTINPMNELARITHERGALVHTDAVQSLGKVPLDVNDLGVDLMSLTAHKLYGPKGIGALYVRRGAELDPMLHGGGQERGKRPGTENVPLAVGFAKAVTLALENMEGEARRLASLRDKLESRIKSEFPAVVINGHPTQHLPHILNLSFDSSKAHLEGEMLVMSMDLRGIAASSGSACTSGSVQPSHVLLAMGRDVATAKATLRLAFGKTNTDDDIDVVVESLHHVVNQMVALHT